MQRVVCNTLTRGVELVYSSASSTLYLGLGAGLWTQGWSFVRDPVL